MIILVLTADNFHCRPDSLQKNQELEFERNKERFEFLKVPTKNNLICMEKSSVNESSSSAHVENILL